VLTLSSSPQGQELILRNRLFAAVAGYEASQWYVVAPRNVPAGILRKLNKEIVSALHDPKMRARIADLGGTTLLGSPADLGKLIADEPKSGTR
jgi:tripartite-type tricarboxylate transporter receptor subunit TctC